MEKIMPKAAIIVLADTETHGDLGRVVNALEAVKELKEARDEVKLIFDGAGTQWIPKLSEKTHRAHRLFVSVEDRIAGACAYCAGAFKATEGVKAANVPLLDEYEGHPSVRQLLADGFSIITF
jgi:hypothetical protein